MRTERDVRENPMAGDVVRKGKHLPAGTVFGRLTVIRLVDERRRKSRCYACLCECGKTTITPRDALISGDTRSCGCLSRERTSKLAKVKHGLSKSQEMQIWIGMRARCLNSKSKNFPFYGGRGITICERWREDFVNFYTDMGPRPSEKHSLDRIDNNKGYGPDNCRWATSKEQARNRTTNRMITAHGATKSVAEWAEILGVEYGWLHNRIRRTTSPGLLIESQTHIAQPGGEA